MLSCSRKAYVSKQSSFIFLFEDTFSFELNEVHWNPYCTLTLRKGPEVRLHFIWFFQFMLRCSSDHPWVVRQLDLNVQIWNFLFPNSSKSICILLVVMLVTKLGDFSDNSRRWIPPQVMFLVESKGSAEKHSSESSEPCRFMPRMSHFPSMTENPETALPRPWFPVLKEGLSA